MNDNNNPQSPATAGELDHIRSILAEIMQLIAKERNEATGTEHYYSHQAAKQVGYAKLYWCACGKSDMDKDRLLRHIRWQELKLTSEGK